MGPMRCSLFFLIVGSALWAEVLPPSFATLPDGRVILVCPTPGAVIRYTFEDKDPDRSAGVYLAPVLVPAGRVIRARSFSADGAEESSTATFTGKGEPSTLLEVTQNRDWKALALLC